jgi:hypothetical protein
MTRNHEMNFYNYGKSLMAGSIVYTSQTDEVQEGSTVSDGHESDANKNK